MAFLDREMKGLSRCIQVNVSNILQKEEVFTVKHIHTHTHTHRHTHTHTRTQSANIGPQEVPKDPILRSQSDVLGTSSNDVP